MVKCDFSPVLDGIEWVQWKPTWQKGNRELQCRWFVDNYLLKAKRLRTKSHRWWACDSAGVLIGCRSGPGGGTHCTYLARLGTRRTPKDFWLWILNMFIIYDLSIPRPSETIGLERITRNTPHATVTPHNHTAASRNDHHTGLCWLWSDAEIRTKLGPIIL